MSPNFRNFIALMESGNIYNINVPKNEDGFTVKKYPRLHSELPPERI